MRKENWENPETNISMVNFMMLTIFFFNVWDWDEGQKAITHWNVTLYLGKPGCLLQVFFEFVRIEGCYLNITYEKKRSSGGPSLCYFLHKCKMKFFTISYIKECCYAYKTYTKILLHIRKHNILQYTILRQFLRHVASLLGNN